MMKDKFRELPYLSDTDSDYSAQDGDGNHAKSFSSSNGDAGGSISKGDKNTSWGKYPFRKRKPTPLGLTPGLGVREKDVVGKFTSELNSFVDATFWDTPIKTAKQNLGKPEKTAPVEEDETPKPDPTDSPMIDQGEPEKEEIKKSDQPYRGLTRLIAYLKDTANQS